MTNNRIERTNILMDLEANNKSEVIKKMSQCLYDNNKIVDLDLFISDVFKREAKISTGIGNFLAIPHGKSNAVVESTIAVAKLRNPVDWNSLDNKSVKVVFLLAIKNEDKGDEHLRILAELSGQLMNDDFVKEIQDANTEEMLFEALKF